MAGFKSKNYKILRRKYKNLRATLHDFEFCKCFLVLTPKHKPQKKEQINWTTPKSKLLSYKDTVIKSRKQSVEWEILFAIHISDKGIANIYIKQI